MKPLTKSRFKIGLECPNKLYFTSKDEYINNKKEDTFLQALAQGGFQVEELARLGYPDGFFIDADHHEYDKAIHLTQEKFTEDNVVLYEAAFFYDQLFVRTDIVEKKGNRVKLIEVKAKSFDPADPNLFVGKRGGLTSAWKPYLFDLAFQKYVAQRAYPDLQFRAYLLMADKTKPAAVNGINQLFRVPKNGDPRKDIVKKVGSLSEIGGTVLSEVDVDDIIDGVINSHHRYFEAHSFEETVDMFKGAYLNDIYLGWPTDFSSCKNCEFRASEQQIADGYLSGFKYCMAHHHGWKEGDFQEPGAMQIWNYRGGNTLVEEGRLLMRDLREDDFKVKSEPGKITQSERQWIQVLKAVNKDSTIHVERESLKAELAGWKFPLHFIDFETSAVALPFTAGRKPYEQVAFQFSHHIYHANGIIEHADQFISHAPGEFPNFIFARALKQALEKDDGTIFMYASHENTIINAIVNQLRTSTESDKEELIEFLKSISTSTKGSADKWSGPRSMVDLRRVVLDYYYNPLSAGSNSIKYVLPACLNSSEFLRRKYGQPISDIAVSSQNFPSSHVWLTTDGSLITNPYELLPRLFNDWDEEDIDNIVSEIDGIADGGAALTAYAKLQYEDMPERERYELIDGLLKYCELDTLAMVMLYEHFREDIVAVME